MSILYNKYFQGLISIIFNEGNLSLVNLLFMSATVVAICAIMYWRSHLTTRKMKAATKMMREASKNGQSSFHFKDGKMECKASFKSNIILKNKNKEALKRIK